jgi:hypothetical protein
MMVTFIAGRIELAGDTSLEAGQEKYRAYFINTNLYLAYKAEVDAILMQDGYGDCIVTA